MLKNLIDAYTFVDNIRRAVSDDMWLVHSNLVFAAKNPPNEWERWTLRIWNLHVALWCEITGEEYVESHHILAKRITEGGADIVIKGEA